MYIQLKQSSVGIRSALIMLVILHADPVEVDSCASGGDGQRHEVAVVVVLLNLSDKAIAGQGHEL